MIEAVFFVAGVLCGVVSAWVFRRRRPRVRVIGEGGGGGVSVDIDDGDAENTYIHPYRGYEH